MDNNQSQVHYIAVTGIISKGAKYLICKRCPNEKAFPNKWCVPGGKLEHADFISTPKDTSAHWLGIFEKVLEREIKEETGLEIKKSLEPFGFCELIHYGKKDHRVVLLLKGKGNGALKETEEGSPEWASAEGIEKKLIPFAREAVKIWKEGKNHFKLLDEECLPSWCL